MRKYGAMRYFVFVHIRSFFGFLVRLTMINHYDVSIQTSLELCVCNRHAMVVEPRKIENVNWAFVNEQNILP